VILLHHKPKSEETLFRGSSDILAAVDQAFILEKRGKELQLRCFKSRFSEERTFNFMADFSTGRFEPVNQSGPVGPRQIDDLLARIISELPGSTTNGIAELSSTARPRVLSALNAGVQNGLWRVQDGPRNSKLYFPINAPVPSQLLEKGSESDTVTSRMTGSDIGSGYREPVETSPVVPGISTTDRWNAGTGTKGDPWIGPTASRRVECM
jgi:hypothetical protein